MTTTVYKPAHVTKQKQNSKIYNIVSETIKHSYLLHADKHTIVLINKIENPGLYTETSQVFLKDKL